MLSHWSVLLQSLVKTRIKPWVNKKIVEYIGEEEPTLVDFICDKVSGLTTALPEILTAWFVIRWASTHQQKVYSATSPWYSDVLLTVQRRLLTLCFIRF